ncbi:MAG: N-acetylglucosamine-6-phosphate deacetylase [Verrucomicrobia bacterium]|nr:N-acetylglucosamine-6-phosphate deacetylase [Verrucomicrobiota bacterium]MBU4498562.1 N-acetylglucosamine-6-phosphate deacetylase [Verrucomicrobiota bacterium]
MNRSLKIFRCTELYTPALEVERTCILVENSRIRELLTPSEAMRIPNAELIDLSGRLVGPGLVDIHCHGAMGSDFADGSTEDISIAAIHHLRKGTTTLLATVGSCTLPEMQQVCTTTRSLMKKIPNLAGVHLEGPYFSLKWFGCHLREMIRNPEREEWSQLEPHGDLIRLVTLAPELPGALEFIRHFTRGGTVFSIGHSNAGWEEIQASIDAGLSHSTHYFCAMPTAHRINRILFPGVQESILMSDRMSTEIIGDGIHVGGRLVEFVYRFKGPQKTALVSDALRGVGCPPGDYAFGPRNGKLCRLLDKPRVGVVPDDPEKLASSAIVLSDALKILGDETKLPLSDLWEMASLTPARILHVDKHKGSIAPGKDADILALAPARTVTEVFVGGKRVSDNKN